MQAMRVRGFAGERSWLELELAYTRAPIFWLWNYNIDDAQTYLRVYMRAYRVLHLLLRWDSAWRGASSRSMAVSQRSFFMAKTRRSRCKLAFAKASARFNRVLLDWCFCRAGFFKRCAT